MTLISLVMRYESVMINPLWLVRYTKTMLTRVSFSRFCSSLHADMYSRASFILATNIVRIGLAWLKLEIWKLRGKKKDAEEGRCPTVTKKRMSFMYY
jgi:hypothetical protein